MNKDLRDKLIYLLYRKNWSTYKLGKYFNLSAEAIRLIIKRVESEAKHSPEDFAKPE